MFMKDKLTLEDMTQSYLNGYGKEVCSYCGMKRTAEGHDGCIGTLEGVMNACCGHGQDNCAYVQFDHPDYKNNPNKLTIGGIEAINYIKKHSKVKTNETSN